MQASPRKVENLIIGGPNSNGKWNIFQAEMSGNASFGPKSIVGVSDVFAGWYHAPPQYLQHCKIVGQKSVILHEKWSQYFT